MNKFIATILFLALIGESFAVQLLVKQCDDKKKHNHGDKHSHSSSSSSSSTSVKNQGEKKNHGKKVHKKHVKKNAKKQGIENAKKHVQKHVKKADEKVCVVGVERNLDKEESESESESEEKRGNKKHHHHGGDFGGFNFESINNASDDASCTEGASMAMGKGKTAISSSIGKKGVITNLEASKGGQSASSFKQVEDNKRSSQLLRKDKKGNVEAIDKASHENSKMNAANKNAFAGKGASAVGLGKDGVIANVSGEKGAANSNSYAKVDRNKASAQSIKKNRQQKRKIHRKRHEDEDSDSDSSCSAGDSKDD